LHIASLRRPNVAYYVSDVSTSGLAPGVWIGRGAANLGLFGGVEASCLRAVLAGSHPFSGQGLWPRPSAVQVAGFDMAFGAPKAVSVAWGLGEQSVGCLLERAHRRAVEAVVEFLEAEVLRARRQEGHMRHLVKTEGSISCCFEHWTSRSNDPHLHSHLLLANLVQGEDGRWSALDSSRLYEYAGALGATYFCEMRRLVREAGVQLELRGGFRHSLRGVSDQLEAVFSTRRRQVLEKLGAWEAESRTARRAAALATRRAKLPLDLAELRAEWAGRIAASGIVRGDIGLDQLRRDEVGPRRALVGAEDLGVLLEEAASARSGWFRRVDLITSLANSSSEGASWRWLVRLVDGIAARATEHSSRWLPAPSTESALQALELAAAESRLQVTTAKGLWPGRLWASLRYADDALSQAGLAATWVVAKSQTAAVLGSLCGLEIKALEEEPLGRLWAARPANSRGAVCVVLGAESAPLGELARLVSRWAGEQVVLVVGGTGGLAREINLRLARAAEKAGAVEAVIAEMIARGLEGGSGQLWGVGDGPEPICIQVKGHLALVALGPQGVWGELVRELAPRGDSLRPVCAVAGDFATAASLSSVLGSYFEESGKLGRLVLLGRRRIREGETVRSWAKGAVGLWRVVEVGRQFSLVGVGGERLVVTPERARQMDLRPAWVISPGELVRLGVRAELLLGAAWEDRRAAERRFLGARHLICVPKWMGQSLGSFSVGSRRRRFERLVELAAEVVAGGRRRLVGPSELGWDLVQKPIQTAERHVSAGSLRETRSTRREVMGLSKEDQGGLGLGL